MPSRTSQLLPSLQVRPRRCHQAWALLLEVLWSVVQLVVTAARHPKLNPSLGPKRAPKPSRRTKEKSLSKESSLLRSPRLFFRGVGAKVNRFRRKPKSFCFSSVQVSHAGVRPAGSTQEIAFSKLVMTCAVYPRIRNFSPPVCAVCCTRKRKGPYPGSKADACLDLEMLSQMPPQLLVSFQTNCEVCKHWAFLHAAKVNTVVSCATGEPVLGCRKCRLLRLKT